MFIVLTSFTLYIFILLSLWLLDTQFNILFPSFFLFLFPFELSLVLSRNSQLHTACYKRAVFLYFKYAVDEWFKKMISLEISGRPIRENGQMQKHILLVKLLARSKPSDFSWWFCTCLSEWIHMWIFFLPLVKWFTTICLPGVLQHFSLSLLKYSNFHKKII